MEENNYNIKQLMMQTECDNDFRCLKVGPKNKCRAKIIGDGRLLDCSKCGSSGCLRSIPCGCNHHLAFGTGHLCTCPVHIHIAQNPGLLFEDNFAG